MCLPSSDEVEADEGEDAECGGSRERIDQHDARRQHARAQLARLSEREREVAMTVGQGRSNAEISGELLMSVPTVKQHVSHILTKLDLNNRTQIALLAHDAGLADTA
jgi:DNA-binding NarL/FixJ family response regulator